MGSSPRNYEMIPLLFMEQEDVKTTVWLCSVAQAQRELINLARKKYEMLEYQALLSKIQGVPEFVEIWDKGQKTPTAQIISSVLSILDNNIDYNSQN